MGLLINLTSSGRTHEACAGLAESSHLTGRGHRPSFLKRSSASLDRMTQVNTDAFVMRICYAKWRQRPTRSRAFIGRISGSDPNGIRTRVTAVKGRCPGPLDDRVIRQLPDGQYRNSILPRKVNCRTVANLAPRAN